MGKAYRLFLVIGTVLLLSSFSSFSAFLFRSYLQYFLVCVECALGAALLYIGIHFRRAYMAENNRNCCVRCGKRTKNLLQNNLCSDCGNELNSFINGFGNLSSTALEAAKLMVDSRLYSSADKERSVEIIGKIQSLAQTALDLYKAPYSLKNEDEIKKTFQEALALHEEQTAILSASLNSSPKKAPVVASVSVTTDGLFAVAGVTFSNDDGSSRQQILHDLCNGGDSGVSDARLVSYQYKGRQAVRVETSLGCVGNIRKTDVSEVMEYLENGEQICSLYIETFENRDGDTIYRADVEIEDTLEEAAP